MFRRQEVCRCHLKSSLCRHQHRRRTAVLKRMESSRRANECVRFSRSPLGSISLRRYLLGLQEIPLDPSRNLLYRDTRIFHKKFYSSTGTNSRNIFHVFQFYKLLCEEGIKMRAQESVPFDEAQSAVFISTFKNRYFQHTYEGWAMLDREEHICMVFTEKIDYET